MAPATAASTSIDLKIPVSFSTEYCFTLTRAEAKKLAKEFADPDIKLEEQMADCLRSWAEFTLTNQLREALEEGFPTDVEIEGVDCTLKAQHVDIDIDDVDEV